MKNNKGLIVMLISIVVILLSIIILFITGVFKLDSGLGEECESCDCLNIIKDTNDNVLDNNINEIEDNNNDDVIVSEQDKLEEEVVEFNLDEMIKIGDYHSIKIVYNNEVSVRLGVDGNVYVSLDNKISNVKDVVDILLFTKFNSDVLYILDKNGDVYKYYVKSNNYIAEKINGVNDVEKILEYNSAKKNAGGCSYLIALSRDGKYYRLNSMCV